MALQWPTKMPPKSRSPVAFCYYGMQMNPLDTVWENAGNKAWEDAN